MREHSRHQIKTRPTEIEVWTETLGDAGICIYGFARIGLHTFKTPSWYDTRTEAEVSALGLVIGHIAGVGVRYERRHSDGAPTLGSLGMSHADDCVCEACTEKREAAAARPKKTRRTPRKRAAKRRRAA